MTDPVMYLFTPGTTPGEIIPQDARKGKTFPIKQLRGNTTLTALSKDYALFTYAPLFLYGGLEHNPIQEWINVNNHGPVVHIVQTPQPVLQLAPPGESRVDSILWACEKDKWPHLGAYISTLGLLDEHKRRFTRCICQRIPILDAPAVVGRMITSVPTLSIFAFGVDGSDACIVFEPAQNLMVDRPTLTVKPPLEETVKFAQTLFAERSDPYGESYVCPVTPPT